MTFKPIKKLTQHKINRQHDYMDFILEVCKFLESVKDWDWDKKELEMIDKITDFVKNHYVIEGEMEELLMEILKIQLTKKLSWIRNSSDDSYKVISSVNDASFYSDIYYLCT